MNDKYYENGHEENDGFVALTLKSFIMSEL